MLSDAGGFIACRRRCSQSPFISFALFFSLLSVSLDKILVLMGILTLTFVDGGRNFSRQRLRFLWILFLTSSPFPSLTDVLNPESDGETGNSSYPDLFIGSLRRPDLEAMRACKPFSPGVALILIPTGKIWLVSSRCLRRRSDVLEIFGAALLSPWLPAAAGSNSSRSCMSLPKVLFSLTSWRLHLKIYRPPIIPSSLVMMLLFPKGMTFALGFRSKKMWSQNSLTKIDSVSTCLPWPYQNRCGLSSLAVDPSIPVEPMDGSTLLLVSWSHNFSRRLSRPAPSRLIAANSKGKICLVVLRFEPHNVSGDHIRLISRPERPLCFVLEESPVKALRLQHRSSCSFAALTSSPNEMKKRDLGVKLKDTSKEIDAWVNPKAVYQTKSSSTAIWIFQFSDLSIAYSISLSRLVKVEFDTPQTHSVTERLLPPTGTFIPSGMFIPTGTSIPSGTFFPSGIFILSGIFNPSRILVLTVLLSIKLICTESVEATMIISMRIEVNDHVSKTLSKWTISNPLSDIEAVLKLPSTTSGLMLDRLINLPDVSPSFMEFGYLSVVYLAFGFCCFFICDFMHLYVLDN